MGRRSGMSRQPVLGGVHTSACAQCKHLGQLWGCAFVDRSREQASLKVARARVKSGGGGTWGCSLFVLLPLAAAHPLSPTSFLSQTQPATSATLVCDKNSWHVYPTLIFACSCHRHAQRTPSSPLAPSRHPLVSSPTLHWTPVRPSLPHYPSTHAYTHPNMSCPNLPPQSTLQASPKQVHRASPTSPQTLLHGVHCTCCFHSLPCTPHLAACATYFVACTCTLLPIALPAHVLLVDLPVFNTGVSSLLVSDVSLRPARPVVPYCSPCCCASV
jgi:hypothetical protein